MKDELKYIYDDVYRWLVFAEAKNLALFAIMGVILEFLFGGNGTDFLYNKEFFYLICFCVLIIIVFLIISFVPFLNKNAYICKKIYEQYKKMYSDNSIFYINIFLTDYKSSIDPTAVSVEVLLDCKGKTLSKMELSLITQIKETSRVAAVKCGLFNWAVNIFLAMIIIYVLSILLCA